MEVTRREEGASPLEEIAAAVTAGERITDEQAATLWADAPLFFLAGLAGAVKERYNGRAVYYNRNFHIEPTNICSFECKFCSYRKPADSPLAWDMTMEEIERLAESYVGSGVTEVHLVGAVHPDRDLYYYCDMIRRVKKILPSVTIKAFSAVELDFMVERAGLDLEQGLRLLMESGMETIPGGGAEIFDEEVRAKICGEKSSARRWLSVHRTAHGLGMKTNATMLYGHIENLHHRIDHLSRLRRLQDQTGGFNAFIPLKYRNLNNSLAEIGEVGVTEDLRTLAISRIYLDNFPHIKAYWPMYGKETTQLALHFGADDIDGTIGDTTKIYSMAGSEEQKPVMGVEEMKNLIRQAGYLPVERDSFYRPMDVRDNFEGAHSVK